MIPREKLKFNETDLNFFDRQLEDKSNKIGEIHNYVFHSLSHQKRIAGSKIAAKFNITPTRVRKIIADIRRYVKVDNVFITANNKGYKLSCTKHQECQEEIIEYFNKTQSRWKETFYELNNLMKILNMIK